MRRRRNADAPIADTSSSETVVPATDSDPAQISPDADAATPLASAGEARVEDQPAATPVAEAEPAKPPRRRNPPRNKAVEEPVAAAPETAPVPEPVAVEPTPDPVTVEAIAPVAEALAGNPVVAEAEKPKRAPRRRRTPAAAAEVDAAAVVETPFVEEVEAPVIETAPEIPTAEALPPADAPVVEETPQAAAPTASSRRRGNLRRRATNATAETPAADAVPEETTAADAAPTEVSADTAPVDATTTPAADDTRNRRNRGGRRRRTAADAAVADATTETEATPVDDSAAADAEAAERRRTRGPRRTAAPGRAETPVVASEPLPPAYQALPDDVLAQLAETRIVVRKNIPDLVINNEPRIPMWFFVNTEEALYGDPDEKSTSEARDVAERQIRLAYDAGIRVFTVLAHLPWRLRSGERRFGPLDDALAFITANAPDAFILPRMIFSPPSSWERAHADQMTRYADGETGDVSIASRAFWDGEADEALRAAVEHVAQGPHAGRVFGFYLEHGEWFYEKGRGYDVSEANVAGFRAWLRSRYKNSQVALRAAWYDGSVTFETAEIPAPGAPHVAGAPLFFSDREQRFVDFHEYSSDIVAQVIIRLGKAVKEASGGRSAVAVSYGYTLELPRSNSGHLALAQVLASPTIDILTGPVSYSGRTPGGSAPLATPIDSIVLAGKLWVSEDDTKSFLAHNDTPDTYNTKIASFEGTWAAYSRNFGAALARGGGISFMDLWGMGWLDDRELWQRIGKLRAIAEALATRRRNPRTKPAPDPDVAVIIDERSFFDVRADESMLSHLIAHQRDALLRSGARIGFYLMSDLLKKNFPSGPKLLIFLNAFRLNDAARAVIRDRFQNDGRTIAWLYGPGCRETNVSELTDVIGMQIRMQPWGSRTGTQILSSARSPLTDNLRGQRVGEETRANPSFYVADPKATFLGEYTINGNPSIAYRKHSRWQSVFIGEMALPIPLLRGLYRLAGIPVYTVDDDVAIVGDCLLSLHSAPGGGTIVYLPEEGVLYDLLTEETLASDGWGARLSMPPRGTRLLFWGAAAEIARLGGDPKAGPPGLVRQDLPSIPAPFQFDSSESRSSQSGGSSEQSSYISEEDDALMQAALAGELPESIDEADDVIIESVSVAAVAVAEPETAPSAAEIAEEAARKKRRRRRRRGRGRSGTDADLDADGAAGDSDADDGDNDSEDGDATDSPESAEAASESASAPRGRPSLEELLPNSEITEGVDLPPIPDEFLPMTELEFTGEAAEPVAEAEAAPVRRRRRGGGASARGRGASRGSETPGVESDATVTPEAAPAADGDGAPGE